MKLFYGLACIGVLILHAGCATHTGNSTSFSSVISSNAQTASLTLSNTLDPGFLQPSGELFALGPGDQLEIEILGNPNSRTVTSVGPDGRLYFSLLPSLDVWGLTLNQTRDLIEKGLSQYLSQPRVSITLREVGSKHVWLIGALKAPGVYPMTGPMTLLEALTLGGGGARPYGQELADLRHSFVMRRGQLVPVDFYRLLREGDMSQNIYLQSGDFVYVPSALNQQVYVLGAVKAPQAVPYTEQMTLISAISAASGAVQIEWLAPTYSGLAPDAYMSHVAIVRGSLSQPELRVVDANAIIKGRAADVPLEPGDIIYVPNAPYSTLKRYFNTIASTFISTVAANAGARAGGAQTVGVSVPVGVH